MTLPAPGTNARRILVYLHHVRCPMVPATIGRAVGLTVRQVASAMCGLERRGLVNCHPDLGDARSHGWAASSKARRLINAVDAAGSVLVRRAMVEEVVDG